jgi:hypothetical protein
MLVYSEFRKSNFYPLKLDLQISGLVLLVFWYSGTSGTSGTLVLCETRVSLSGRSSH